ncbi:DoxX family protein [Amycolatopsis sp. H20-H5]|uniref:DoxX family protein n=1 Tax=Amycolatopsis sp. H20-H5 TaxID=3046309 RepID=UPI002DBDB739|nr:DoxX family protein [Amycolatopsis sp. H20-H5]MEC3973800.1 DoxX family protein [Amycolatopsis sp. H20-H5]
MSSHEDSYQNTSLLSDVEDTTPDRGETRAGIDLGLLVLRVVLGVIMGAHGLQHLFGAFGGPGVGGFAKVLGLLGYTQQTTLLSWITGVSEVLGSLLVIVGLFTPLGAAALLGVAVNIVYSKFHGGFFQGQGQGFEFELLIGASSLALLFTGAGRLALDVNTPWRRRPLPYALVGLLLAAAASVVVIVLCRR